MSSLPCRLPWSFEGRSGFFSVFWLLSISLWAKTEVVELSHQPPWKESPVSWLLPVSPSFVCCLPSSVLKFYSMYNCTFLRFVTMWKVSFKNWLCITNDDINSVTVYIAFVTIFLLWNLTVKFFWHINFVTD